jgi:hypothetical protein
MKTEGINNTNYTTTAKVAPIKAVVQIPSHIFENLKNGNIPAYVAILDGDKIIATPYGEFSISGMPSSIEGGTYMLLKLSQNQEFVLTVLKNSVTIDENNWPVTDEVHATDVSQIINIKIDKINIQNQESEIKRSSADKWIEKIMSVESKLSHVEIQRDIFTTFRDIYLTHLPQYRDMVEILDFTKHMSWNLYLLPFHLRERNVMLYTYIKDTGYEEAKFFKVELSDEEIGPISVDIMIKGQVMDCKLTSREQIPSALKGELQNVYDSVCKDMSFGGSIFFKIDPSLFHKQFFAEMLHEHYRDKALNIMT